MDELAFNQHVAAAVGGDLSSLGKALKGLFRGVTSIIPAGATLTVTADKHAGRVIILDTASGSVCTLPAASGSGVKFKFIVSVTVTSAAHKVAVANSSDVMYGWAFGFDEDVVTPNGWLAGASDDTISMDGTTQGGKIGDWVEVTDIADNVWSVVVSINQSGTEATPFSAAV